MQSSINKIAVVGTGVIGTGWIIRFLFNKKQIKIFDPSEKQKKFLLDELKRTAPLLKKFYKSNININNQLEFCSSIKAAVSDADLIQENTPENEKLKIRIIKEIRHHSKKNAIIASSSSGLLPSRIQSKARYPERVLIAHPFNPVYLLPLVEIVPGKKTTKKNFLEANKFFT